MNSIFLFSRIWVAVVFLLFIPHIANANTPVAPIANAGGLYVFCPDVPMILNATGSTNPDEGLSEAGQPGDTIQRYDWDLNGNGNYIDALAAQPDVTSFFTALGAGDYPVSLRVTDTSSSAYPSIGMGDLSSTDSAQVSIKGISDASCTCLSDLSARSKSGKVQMVWSDSGAHHYNVYRGTTAGGPYTFLASTDSRYSTYLDTSVVDNTQYFFIVRTAAANNSEICQSVEVSATRPRVEEEVIVLLRMIKY